MDSNKSPSWMSCRTIIENSFGHQYILELKISTADHSDSEFQALMQPHESQFVDLLRQIVTQIIAPIISPPPSPAPQQLQQQQAQQAKQAVGQRFQAAQANAVQPGQEQAEKYAPRQ